MAAERFMMRLMKPLSIVLAKAGFKNCSRRREVCGGSCVNMVERRLKPWRQARASPILPGGRCSLQLCRYAARLIRRLSDGELSDETVSAVEKEKPMPTTVAIVLSVVEGCASLIITVDRPKARFEIAGCRPYRGLRASILKETIRPIVKAHEGPDKSVYAYAMEDMRWWEEKLGRSLQYGEFGENLTTEGIAVNDALVGERWAIGTAVFEVSEPRIPCWRLGVRMNDQMFPRRFTEALRPGTYLRIIVEGAVGAGDEIRIIERPDHDLTIRDIFRIYTRDREEVERLLAVPRISESWRGWAQHFLKETKGRARRLGSSWMLLISNNWARVQWNEVRV